MTRHGIHLRRGPAILAAFLAIIASKSPALADETQAAIAAPTGTTVLAVHAAGAQVYECKTDPSGSLVWQFREPIATLLQGGKTVGRHFAGPIWEAVDGSRVVGKVVSKAPGASAADIPWLRLSVVAHQGSGMLDEVTTVQRLNTAGGVMAGPCPVAGAVIAEPYAADYVLSRP